MSYFSGIKVGDKFFVWEKEFEVKEVSEEGWINSSQGIWFTVHGHIFGFPEIGQVAFWQPVHIDPPPRPKRMVRKVMDVIINYYPRYNYWGGIFNTTEEAKRNSELNPTLGYSIQVPIHHEWEEEEE